VYCISFKFQVFSWPSFKVLKLILCSVSKPFRYVGGVKEKHHTLKLQIYAYDLSASSSGRIIYIWTKYCVVLVKWGKFLSLRNYGCTAYRQWNSLLSSYCTLLFSGATSRCSRRPHEFQGTNIYYFRHRTGLSEGQSAYLNASIYNERKHAELKLCTEWHRNQQFSWGKRKYTRYIDRPLWLDSGQFHAVCN
jgi:hypothetical protein